MSQLERLTELMADLGKLGRLVTVCSPEHPPDARLAGEIEAFLDGYRYLHRDAGYVAFLRHYAGAALKSYDDMLSLDLFGFSEEVTVHLVHGEGEIVENGLLTFADLLIPLESGLGVFVKTAGCGFGFPESAEQRWGVYKINEDRSFWYCSSFLEWLAHFIDKKGRLLD